MSQLEPKKYPVRTNQQNKALHVLFELLANELNDSGLDMRKTLKPDVEIPWSKEAAKQYLWKPVMKAQLNLDSTTQLNTKQIDEVFETINRYLGENHGVTIPFPSIDEVIWQQEEERRQKALKRKANKA